MHFLIHGRSLDIFIHAYTLKNGLALGFKQNFWQSMPRKKSMKSRVSIAFNSSCYKHAFYLLQNVQKIKVSSQKTPMQIIKTH